MNKLIMLLFSLIPSMSFGVGFSSLVEQASQDTGVPSNIISKVCTHESKTFHNGKTQPWPWTLNVSGKGYWFKSKMTAVVYAKLELMSGNSMIDVGICQINWYWHGGNFDSIEELMNPKNNIYYAATYLKKIKGGQSWEYAVGAYHSLKNKELAKAYAEKVLSQ
ncbi:transglycosylase SLT domain-containing protein [Shewanella xiamenensis]|uniref:transglycosylase SLT domain-containing protein n=1 Tax=Shewanella xiamenensis TaxID=332186 RepID=UPI0021C1ED1A|nr:transglycosylase SLT domain-containing protein [Shewanella xiamenensis]MCT8873809.1 transglycosylase SLT domain-containing protein [Shewanella xiamenensis]